jgi:hypothetical protein
MGHNLSHLGLDDIRMVHIGERWRLAGKPGQRLDGIQGPRRMRRFCQFAHTRMNGCVRQRVLGWVVARLIILFDDIGLDHIGFYDTWTGWYHRRRFHVAACGVTGRGV